MAHFTSWDGTKLGYRRAGAGRPLVCLPGGPGRTPDYLGDLGGLAGTRELVLPDTRGTGESEVPADPGTFRCDRLAMDVEALRAELGLDRMDLLGHSAAGNVALLYAAAHPERIDHLVLVTPGLRALGLELTDEEQHAAMQRRSGEPWYLAAAAAVQAAEAGDDSDPTRLAYLPFFYGRWDEAAQAHALAGMSERARGGDGRRVRGRRVRPACHPGGAGWPGCPGPGVRGRGGHRPDPGVRRRGGPAVPRLVARGAAGSRPFSLAGRPGLVLRRGHRVPGRPGR